MFHFPVYRKGVLPTPGVGDVAFTNLSLSAESPIGAGTQVKGGLTLAAPLSFQNQQYRVEGYGGHIHGQIITQPIFIDHGDK